MPAAPWPRHRLRAVVLLAAAGLVAGTAAGAFLAMHEAKPENPVASRTIAHQSAFEVATTMTR